MMFCFFPSIERLKKIIEQVSHLQRNTDYKLYWEVYRGSSEGFREIRDITEHLLQY